MEELQSSEYKQLTIDDWLKMKEYLRTEMLGVRQGMVRIGYILRKMEENEGYKLDGYASFSEFAKAEYGLDPSTVSRFKAVNEQFSVDGYSEMIAPEFADFKQYALLEMINLPPEDRKMVTPGTSRETIRDIKKHNREVKKAEKARKADEKPPKREMERKEQEQTHPEHKQEEKVEEQASAEHQPQSVAPPPIVRIRTEEELIQSFWENNQALAEKVKEAIRLGESYVENFIDLIVPEGDKTYKQGLWFMSIQREKVFTKKMAMPPREIPWEDFIGISKRILHEDEVEVLIGEVEETELDTVPIRPKRESAEPETTIAPTQLTYEERVGMHRELETILQKMRVQTALRKYENVCRLAQEASDLAGRLMKEE